MMLIPMTNECFGMLGMKMSAKFKYPFPRANHIFLNKRLLSINHFLAAVV